MKTKLPIISFIAAIVTMLIGILVIIGWFTHNDFLEMLAPGQVKMKFNAASGFMLSSIVLLLNYSSGKSKIRHHISVLLSVVVSLIGLLTLIEYIFSFNLGIDELFVKDEIRTTAIYYAGRMSPLAAINFLLIGTGLLLLNKAKTATYQFYYLSAITFIALLMLIGFNFISDIPTYIRLAIHVAIGFISLSIAIWFAQPMLQKKISFERKLFTVFAAVIILMVVLGIFSSYYSNKRISTAKLVEHTSDVLNEAEQTLSITKDIESGSRGYVITGDSNYLEHFMIAKDTVFDHLKKLKELTAGNPVQQVRIDSLSALVDKRINFSLQSVVLRKERGVEAANQLIATRLGKSYMDKIRDLIFQIQQEENNLHTQRQKGNRESITSFNRVFFVFLAGVLILLVIILFSIRNNIVFRKKAEAALTKLNIELEQRVKDRTEEVVKNEKRFRALIENNYDIISLLDRSFKIFYRSPSAVRITGWTDEEIMDTDGTKNIHQDDREKASNIVKEIMANPGKPVNCLFRHLHKDGYYLWVEGVVINLLQDEYVKAIVFNFRDVTERIEAEEKIIASEKQFRSTLDNMLEGIQIHDFNWRYIYTNDTLIKYSKYSREELLGHTLMEKYPGIEQTNLFKVMQRCMNERVTEHLETEFIFPNGTKTDFELSIQPVPEGIFILSIDISERKKAEAAILRAEANYREIFDKANDAIYVHEIGTGKVINVNHRATELNGFSKEELMTGDPHDFMTDHPDYTFEKAFGYIQKAAGGEPQFFEWLGRCKDGSSSWFEMNLKRTNIGGQDRILAFQRDINDRKKGEEKLIKSEKIYKTIASSIPGSVICLLDPDYRYLLIEGDMIEKLGYSKDKLLGNKAEDVLPPEIFAGVQEEFKRVFEGETITRESSTHGYDIISKVIPFKDERNIVYAIMTVDIDVTELKNAQRDIIELNRGLEEKIINRTEQLRKSNEELEAFSYSVSHDLRAPLRAIIGFTAILEEDYGSQLDDEARRITSVIKNNTMKMGNLIDDLLAFSRMGRHEIAKTSINTNVMVNEIINDLDKKSGNRGIEWLVHSLPPINGDISMIRQVWVNLISNAIKYSGNKEQPQIEIGVSTYEGQMVFFVKDNGVGFDKQYSDKLFKVFQRLHSADEFEGTGVGLALVEKIILKHGGKVWAEAEVNKGATFYFSLPDGHCQNNKNQSHNESKHNRHSVS